MSTATPAASGQWTLGVLIGGPFWLLCILAVLIVGAVLTVWAFRDEGAGWGFGVIGCTLLALAVVVGIGVWAFWPLKAEYHQYRAVTGVVATTNSRLIASGTQGGGSNQKYVLTLRGNPQQYGVNDTRAAALKVGDTVHLRCVRSYEYGSNDAGWDCKWGQ